MFSILGSKVFPGQGRVARLAWEAPMIESIEEPVEVLARFDRGHMTPFRFRWNQSVFKIAKVTGEWEDREGKAISRFVHDLVTEWGGSISAEHGIGQLRRRELHHRKPAAELALMRRIKRLIDPGALMNPGKLV